MRKMNLKKMIACACVMAASVITLAGCGSDADSQSGTPGEGSGGAGVTVVDPVAAGEPVTVFNYDMNEYIELGDYTALDVTYNATEVTDDYVDYAYESFFSDYASSVDPSDYETDRAVVNGDLIILDFSGKKDGVAFEGGTSTGYPLEIGSGSFIPGFEDGLIGVMPGEEVDLDLTFPENYGNPDLAGQAVVFTCTVQGIITTDSIIATANKNLEDGQSPVNNEDDLRELCRTELIKQAAEADREDLESQIAQQLVGVITEKQEFPDDLKGAYDQLVLKSVNNAATYYGIDAETLLSYYGTTVDDYVAEYSKTQLLNDAALKLIAEEKGLLLSEEQLDARLEEYKAEYNVPDEEMFAQLSRSEYRVYFMEQDVLDVLVELYTK